jgi:hypothetical protein
MGAFVMVMSQKFCYCPLRGGLTEEISLAIYSALIVRTQRSEKAFRLGLRPGSITG